MTYSLGIDIGGTKIAAGLVDKTGNYSYGTQFPSIKTDREAMFRQIVRCVKEVLKKSGVSPANLEGVGIGVPGKVDIEKGIAQFQNNLPWVNFPLLQRIKEQLPVEKVLIDNDVYMATFAEWVVNGKKEQETFVYCTISTGVACCTIHNGSFIRGAGFAGEIGFLPIGFNPSSGQYKSLEAVASGSGIAELASERGKLCKSAANVIEDFKKQDPFAISLMNDVFDYIARGLYAICCLLDPHKLIIGGGVMNHHPDLLHPVKNALEQYLSPEQADILHRIDVSRLKGNAGVVGAGLKVRMTNE